MAISYMTDEHLKAPVSAHLAELSELHEDVGSTRCSLSLSVCGG